MVLVWLHVIYNCLPVFLLTGALDPLVSSTTHADLNCQRFASLSIANLATTVAAQVRVIQAGAVRPLIALGECLQ